MTRLLRLVALTVALLFAAPTAHAGFGSGPASGPVGTPVISTAAEVDAAKVMLVGDSISVRSYKDLAALLPVPLAVNAHSGRNTKLSIDSLFKQMQGRQWPRVLVMATGSNDIFGPGAMREQVRRLLAGVPESTRVFWVNIRVQRPGFVLADRVNTWHVNEAIQVGCTGRCSVVSWVGFLAGKPYRPATYIDAGGVHPTVLGSKAWGCLIATAVKPALL